MNWLALETSSPLLSIALKKGNNKTEEFTFKGFLRHAENLLPAIDRLLKKKGLRVEAIDAFCIGRGPGSYTGLRIGFAALKGFLVLMEKPCYGAESLDIIAQSIPPQSSRPLVVCLDARQEKIYEKTYRFRKNAWRADGKIESLSLKEFLRKLPEGASVTGDALKRYKKEIEQAGSAKRIFLLPEKFWYPRASLLIQSPFLKQLKKPDDFLPLYRPC